MDNSGNLLFIACLIVLTILGLYLTITGFKYKKSSRKIIGILYLSLALIFIITMIVTLIVI